MFHIARPFPLAATGRFGVLVSAALFAVSGAVSVAEGQPPQRVHQQRDVGNATTSAAAAVASSNARLAAVIARGGAIVRSKGVQSVSNPFIGTYCIRPTAASGVSPRNVVPVVTVDYDRSVYNEVMAQYSDTGLDCPSGTVEVLTFDDRNLDAAYFDSNLVGFTIVVN
jgi:hypothetical protein